MSTPAPLARTVLAQTAMELRLTARRTENVLAIAVIPAAVLVFFATTDVIAVPGGTQPVDFLLPGAIALGLIAAGLVNLGIATAYERHYGVLKRLGASPLPKVGLVSAKLAAVGVAAVLQLALLVAIAAGPLGWRPGPTADPVLLAAALTLGTLTFAGLGLLLAGTLRAETTLAVANGLFLAALLLGGIIVPIDHLAAPLEQIAAILPAHALTETLRIGLGHPIPGAPTDPIPLLATLAAWGAAATALTIRTFRWE